MREVLGKTGGATRGPTPEDAQQSETPNLNTGASRTLSGTCEKEACGGIWTLMFKWRVRAPWKVCWRFSGEPTWTSKNHGKSTHCASLACQRRSLVTSALLLSPKSLRRVLLAGEVLRVKVSRGLARGDGLCVSHRVGARESR